MQFVPIGPIAPENVVGTRRNLPPEIVAGPETDATAVTRGLRVLLDLVGARNAVLFSLLPQGPLFHAALGESSASLARQVEIRAGELNDLIRGPCILARDAGSGGGASGEDGHASPIPEAFVLGDRQHRHRALGVALSPASDTPASLELRFAHAVFRDVARLTQRRERHSEPTGLLDQEWEKHRHGGLVGRSRLMRQIFRTVEKLGRSDANVLVLGESGTGKELVARAIHQHAESGPRKFVAQNCAALPEALLESELFGHCKGAFTGALFDRKGLFEEANGGTFFLDEIADMPMALQIKMLRVLQDGEIRRLGETRVQRVTVRIIAATNKNLIHEVERGRFREDLFYRLNVVRLELPPLRRRRDDVPLLVRYFTDHIGSRLRRPIPRISEATMQRLLEYDWPGNVRELENEVERLVALHGDEGTIEPYMLSERLRYGNSVHWSLERLEEIQDLHRATEYLERAMIGRSLERHSWNKSRCAEELGISRQGLIKKIKRLRLLRPEVPGTQAGKKRRLARQGQLALEKIEVAATQGGGIGAGSRREGAGEATETPCR